MTRGSGLAINGWVMLAAGVIGAASPLEGPAATETVRPDAADDFRAAYATSQDIAEGKRVADASCARCHGSNGISAAKGVPHLAGQRSVYLHAELQAYKSGARGKGMMADAAKFLSEDALIKVAAWYSALDPAQPMPAATTKAVSSGPDPVGAGKAAAASCAGCHGEAGISKTPGMPNLVGQDSKYLAAATKAYKTGQRKHDLMKALVAGLGDADIGNIAHFYAAQKPERAQTTAAGDPVAGKAVAGACVACHGEAGVSSDMTPSLAGQDAQYFVSAMHAYRDGSRTDPMMKGPAGAVADKALADVAAYYASLPPQPPKSGKSPSTADWVQRCDRCHGFNGNSTDARVPALAAQRADYLERMLNAYRSGERKSPAMSAMSKVLADADVGRLASHYSQQKARAVVYVQLPAIRKQ